MDMIISLIGPSGSGKTSIAQKLQEKGYNVIQSYTTRKPREENEWGHTFVDNYDNPDDVIAYENLYGNHYWATKEQYKNKGISIYIIDPQGDKKLRKAVDCPVISIFLYCDYTNCYRRMSIIRGTESALERIQKDSKMFSFVKCDYVVDANRSIVEVYKDVEKAIELEEAKCDMIS